jgi:N-acetylglucosaminyldiphosphoundecaprenol N-acetyl-beta-D-mannosaminyltransferase
MQKQQFSRTATVGRIDGDTRLLNSRFGGLPASASHTETLMAPSPLADLPPEGAPAVTRRRLVNVLGSPIDVLSHEGALNRIAHWAASRESRYICITNAHSLVTATQEPEFAEVVRRADMATPDGVSVTWMLRWQGAPDQQRLTGPDLMWQYCEQAATRGEGIFLYGSSAATLERLQVKLLAAFPGLVIAGALSPPFRPLTAEEDEAQVRLINASGATTVWVGLGCPKQERWMAAHRGRIQAVMVGVGAAFDFHAGTIRRAPVWMQNIGLEWLHRVLSEPRRLWRRYLVTNTLFVVKAALQLVHRRRDRR